MASDLPKPEMEGERRVLEIFRKPLVGLHQHLLDHIAGIHSTRERGIETVADHPPQRGAMLCPQPFRRTLIMMLDAVKQDPRFELVGPHSYLVLIQETFISIDYIEKKSARFR